MPGERVRRIVVSESNARATAALGCICLTFDLRGHEQTRGQFDTVSREDNLRDVLAAYDVLAGQRGVDPTAIAVVGSSYGGYLAAILSSLRPVRALALRAPALYKDTDWTMAKRLLRKQQELDRYRLRTVRPGDSRALLACTMFEGDVLIVESEHDDVVPRQVIENYRGACGRARSVTYRVLQGADHGLSTDPLQRAYTRLLVDWLAETVIGVAFAPGVDDQARIMAQPHA